MAPSPMARRGLLGAVLATEGVKGRHQPTCPYRRNTRPAGFDPADVDTCFMRPTRVASLRAPGISAALGLCTILNRMTLLDRWSPPRGTQAICHDVFCGEDVFPAPPRRSAGSETV